MENRDFDALAKALARGKNRRAVLKAMLGLGGAATAGSIALGEAGAARRGSGAPTPAVAPAPTCPPGEVLCSDGCCAGACTAAGACCPTGNTVCGPDCCNATIPIPQPGYSECCDAACCVGSCYGEELCCPTNVGPGGQNPTHKLCIGPNPTKCCAFEEDCCFQDGCCSTVCYGGDSGIDLCCPQENYCPGTGQQGDLCCLAGTICCPAGTEVNACVDRKLPNSCCGDIDCTAPCSTCDLFTRMCVGSC